MDDTTKQTLRDLLACFEAWEGAVRVLGNVRADDAARAIRAALAQPAQAPAQPALRSLLVRARNLLSHPAHWSEVNAESRHRLSVEIAEYLAQPALSMSMFVSRADYDAALAAQKGDDHE